jgi:hypothetical protein
LGTAHCRKNPIHFGQCGIRPTVRLLSENATYRQQQHHSGLFPTPLTDRSMLLHPRNQPRCVALEWALRFRALPGSAPARPHESSGAFPLRYPQQRRTLGHQANTPKIQWMSAR